MPSENCRIALGSPFTQERCLDFREARRIALCGAWQKMEAEHIPFARAIKKSWQELKGECAAIGVHSPEPVDVEKSSRIVDRETGKMVGIISLGKDDNVEVCIKDACYTAEKGGSPLYYLAQSYYAALSFGIASESD